MIGISLRSRTAVAAGILCVFAGTGQASAQDIELPGQLAWTAYDVGSGGYNQAVAIGGALKNELGIDLRVLPGRNDVSRQVPLRQGRVQFSATGVGASYLAQEGVFEFGGADWGPQAVRLLLAANGDGNLGIGVAADAGIETIADLAGKRVAYVVGAPSLNENITAILAFANLTWDDVERVEFSGFGAAWEAIINDQADAAFAASTSGQAYQLEASPRGLFWPPLPHDDTEGWQRLQERAPFFIPNDGTEGAAMGADNVNEAATYPYPVLTTYAEQDTSLVYNMTKAMVELYPTYQDSAPGINGWALDNQVFAWAVPYHEGAVEYFREAGVWTEEHDAHNDALIERQGVLAAAWEEMQGEEVAEADFEARWMEVRAQKLEEAGLSVVFE